MKKNLSFLVAGLLCCSYAFAEDQLSADAVNILNAVSNCPKEFSQLSSQGMVVNAYHDSTPNSESYAVYFSSKPASPLAPRFPIGMLSISGTFQKNPGPAPADGSAGQMIWTCTITKER